MNKTDLASKTKSELLKIAQRLGLRGISTLSKADLMERIQEAQESSAARVHKQPMGVAAVVRRVADAVKRRGIRKRDRQPAAAAPEPVPAPAAVAPNGPAARPPRRSPISAPLAVEQPGTERVSDELSAHKFEVAAEPLPPTRTFREEHLGELPESYGTSKLYLVARDPHWLYAYWDLTWQQMADYRGQSSDGRLVVRVFEKNHGDPIQELTLGHDTRNWYIPVNKAATTYTAELGFWKHDGRFHTVSRSREATTPSDAVSSDATARFVTIPIDISFRQLFEIIRGHMHNGETLAEALHRLQRSGFRFPFRLGLELGPWTAEQEAELGRLLGGDILRRMQMGSFEISEWLRRRLQEELSSGLFSAFSPFGASWSAAAPQQGFWFAVNAELIVYGATEPNAKVTIDGKPVKLRSDGTFSFHHTFPDGQYKLPVVAVAAAGDDKRTVELTFERKTKTKGDVGKVRQPAHLSAPGAA